MIQLLDTLPLWLLAILLNAWLMGLALIGLWISRRFVLPRMRLGYDDAYVAAAIVQSVMMLYGLIAALTAVGVWQRYNDVSQVVSAHTGPSLHRRDGHHLRFVPAHHRSLHEAVAWLPGAWRCPGYRTPVATCAAPASSVVARRFCTIADAWERRKPA